MTMFRFSLRQQAFACSLFAVLLCLPLAQAGPGLWTSSGPEAGNVFDLVASPDSANVFYAIGNGGVYKTVNGGVTWTEANAGLNRRVFALEHSQTAPNRLYVAGSRKLYFSNDAALSWQDRTPPPALLPADVQIVSMDASPVVPGRIYIGLSNSTLLRSDDAGISWLATTAVPSPVAFQPRRLLADPVLGDGLLVATEDNTGFGGDHGLYRSTDAGASWAAIACPVDCPWQDNALQDIEHANAAGKLWAVNSQGVHRSTDGGTTWTPVGTFAVGGGTDLDVHPGNPDQLYLAGRLGLAYTTDDGASWTEVLGGFVGNDALLPTNSTVVAYDPFNPAIQLAGSISNGVYRRNALPPLDNFVPGVDGFSAANIRAVTSTLGNRVHAAIGDAFNPTFVHFISNNNGQTWSQANSALGADHFRDITVDPNSINTVYAGGRSLPHDDGTGTVVPGDGAIYKSIDGGATWSTIDNGIPLTPAPFVFSLFGTVRAITVDPFSCVGGTPCAGASQTLYAGGSGRYRLDGGSIVKDAANLYKSTDAGATWVPMDSGLDGTELGVNGFPVWVSVVQIELDTTDVSGNTLYAATFLSGFDQLAGAPAVVENGVFKSVDGGVTWVHASNGLPRLDGIAGSTAESVLSLEFDESDPSGQTLYASTNELDNSVLGTVYKTTDGGLNWSFAGTGLTNRDVRDLAVDPLTGDVYAAVADPLGNGDGGVFVSRDGGANWSSLSTGFPNTAVATKLALDNTGSNLLIHAGTTQGVQSFEVIPDGDIDGATDPTENGAPNGGDGNLDGTGDSGQPEVASPEINDPANRGTQSFMTVSLTPISGSCDRLENSFGLDLLNSIPVEASYEMPFNGVHLRIPDCEQAELELIYHDTDFSDATYLLRNYGLQFPDENTTGWDLTIAASRVGNVWTFPLTDGAAGDATPDDGIIVFQGGAKRLREVFFADGLEVE